jgi:hypothetical protein
MFIAYIGPGIHDNENQEHGFQKNSRDPPYFIQGHTHKTNKGRIIFSLNGNPLRKNSPKRVLLTWN